MRYEMTGPCPVGGNPNNEENEHFCSACGPLNYGSFLCKEATFEELRRKVISNLEEGEECFFDKAINSSIAPEEFKNELRVERLRIELKRQ